MLAYRNTPIEEIGLSPAQMLMGSRTGTELEPQYLTGNIKNGLSRRTEIQQQYYKRNGKVLKPLNTGDTVLVRKSGQKT